MGQFKGTRGKWKIKHSESKTAINIVGTIPGEKYKIARVPYFTTDALEVLNQREKCQAESDAKLISVAPEMLEMLIKCENIIGVELEYYSSFREKLQELIKKATE